MADVQTMRKVRQMAKMSPTTLAVLADVSVRYIHALESGERTNPSIGVLLRLAAALDVPVDTIAR